MRRSRGTLHQRQLEPFARFCEAHGWKRASLGSPWEVLRMKHADRRNPLIVHTRAEAREHFTTWGESQRMLVAWIKERRSETRNSDRR